MIASGTNALGSIDRAGASSPTPRLRTRRQGAHSLLCAASYRRHSNMRQGSIAPRDLTQAIIRSRNGGVLKLRIAAAENDGAPMSVKAGDRAHQPVMAGEVQDEQLGDLDADTRFCVTWYEQYG